MIYEELERTSVSTKEKGASSNAITKHMDHEQQEKNESGSPRDALREPRQRREWKNIKDYTFNIGDTERWFEVLKSKGKITPWTPKNPPKP